MKIHYFGHSAFALEGSENILIDPFISGNPHMQGRSLPQGMKFSHIFLTHGHGDHTGDVETLAKFHQATVVANFELASLMAGRGLKVESCSLGGLLHFPWGWVRQVPATHSSSFEGQYAGAPVGLIINIGGVTVYHAGDTGLFGDMELIGQRYQPQVALLPIGSTFTMDCEEALEAVKKLRPQIAIPMHYNTFPVIKADPQAFKARVEAETPTKVQVLKACEVFEV